MARVHPTVEEMERFLRSATGPGTKTINALIVRHLLSACAVCRDQLRSIGWTGTRLERLVDLPARIGRQEGPGVAGTRGYNYDSAFAKTAQTVGDFLAAAPPPSVPLEALVDEVDQTSQERQLALVEQDPRFASPRLMQTLIDRSHAARYAAPETMVHWASMARSVATRCSPETAGGAARLSDLRARAWGQYGNALRVAGQLREAEEAMITAKGYCKTGTGDPALKARLCEQLASLLSFQRRFGTAIATLGEAAETYRLLGETHALARTLVQQASALIYSGEPEKAVGLLNRTIPLIDLEGDPHLLLAACHNLVQCYIHLEEPEHALSIYSETRNLYTDFSDSLILLRVRWQEGQLLRDLGHLREAETALLHAREGFMERRLVYEVALVCLDLAAVYVKMKAIDDLKQTVTATVPIFRALRVDREALASLLQLQRVADQEQQAMDLIRFLTARIEPLAKTGMPK